MSETPTPQHNQLNGQEYLRPFSELLAQTEIVYHGIGADVMALYGIAQHGLTSVTQQLELTGSYNSNSPRDKAWNGDDKISVAQSPKQGLPNDAFMEYIEGRPISFAIDSNQCPTDQPSERGIYDEAFVDSAPPQTIVGVVLDGKTMGRPITESPIVGHMEAVHKSRVFMQHLIDNYDKGLESALPELEELLQGADDLKSGYEAAMDISDLDLVYDPDKYDTIDDFMRDSHDTLMAYAQGKAAKVATDEAKVATLNTFLQNQLAKGLLAKFGRSDVTVLDLVRDAFPDKKLYVNNHDDGIELYPEHEYFDTLPDDAVIGYQRWDGMPGEISVHKLRRALNAVHGEEPQS